jgi:hypothetical protein
LTWGAVAGAWRDNGFGGANVAYPLIVVALTAVLVLPTLGWVMPWLAAARD